MNLTNNYKHLAIDIGASGGTAVVGSSGSDRQKLLEVYRFNNQMENSDAGLVWNINHLFKEILTSIKIASEKYPDLKSVGIDTWGVDYVLMNGDEPLLPVYAYRNDRTKSVIDEVHGIIPFEKLYGMTGCQFQRFNTLYQLYADKQANRLEKASDFLMLPDYFYYRLTGIKTHEYTNATTTGMVNPLTGEFDQDLVRTLGMPKRLFPKITQPGLCHPVRKEYSKTGLISVLVATHDTASAVESLDISGNTIYISSGTWSLIGVKRDKPIRSEQAMKSNFTNEGGLGYTRFQKNIMGLWIVQELKREFNIETYEEMVRLAKMSCYQKTFDVNDSRYLSPKSMYREIEMELRKRYDKSPENKGDIINSVFHSLAKCYSVAVEEIETITGKKYDSIIIFGGGAKNNYLNSLVENYTKKTVNAYPIEASALGNIKIQSEVIK